MLAGKRALIVDDLALNREILARRLGRWNMHTVTVNDGLAALIAIDEAANAGRPFDIVLLDRHMPGQTGHEVAEAIRRLEAGRTVRLILCSSISHGVTVSAGQGTQFDAVLFKPLLQGALLEALAAAVTDTAAVRNEGAARRDGALAGARILLVEDNETNLLAANTMLNQMGCSVTAAHTGLEAVRAAASNSFDLILMDMQMPEMDGLEATRHIRATAGPNRTKPILALTANAFVEDAARCKDAGMNEHLTKPIRRAALEAALSRHLGGRAAEGQGASAPRANTGAAAFDAQAWDDLRQDMSWDALKKLAATFVTNQAREIEAMQADLKGGDGEALRRRAHSLKGAARLLGAIRLAEAAAALETQSSPQMLQTVRDLFVEASVEIGSRVSRAA
jgi:CheY-like chemotaxis protein/HPt (histidine-containing phosphotransfer) domain-containing protein